MNRFWKGRIHCSVSQLVLASAAFLLLFANLAFFRNLSESLTSSNNGALHFLLLGLMLAGVLVLFLALLSFRRLLKPALAVLFITSAATAYFMDTYNVVIDQDMLRNALATDAAETADLMTLRFWLYLGLLGLLPTWLLTRVELPPQKAGQAALSRVKLAGGALLLIVSLAVISSGFFIPFMREHKELRFYSNPLTPVYAVYKLGKKRLAREPAPLQAIGTDAHIGAEDPDRELVIVVVGETARADRFSLNGYDRETNPRLAREDVISFHQVSACGTSTAISVPCMFDMEPQASFDIDAAGSMENVLDVLHHAGVSLLWRDNNSSSKGVADRIPYEDFRTPELNPVCDEECRDEGLLAGLREHIAAQPGGDILVVLHQMGSHGPAYYKRYPEAFRVFQPTCDTSQIDNCSKEAIGNTYDNTILYTDHFLAEVIELLSEYDEDFDTAMIYVGDHGESLGEFGVYLHGLPAWMAPEAQTRVPMLMWFGDHYDDADTAALRQLANSPVSHDELFHTLLGLFEVDTEVYDSELDLIERSRQLSGAVADRTAEAPQIPAGGAQGEPAP
jgi:lipid A ethanolaminephosphotransferase